MFFTNCYFICGRSRQILSKTSQEVIEGNILKILFDVPEILNNKFLTKKIKFEGLQRIEKGEYPVAAIREMLLNALVHKHYSGAQNNLEFMMIKLQYGMKVPFRKD